MSRFAGTVEGHWFHLSLRLAGKLWLLTDYRTSLFEECAGLRIVHAEI